jgi:hypothetical protein
LKTRPYHQGTKDTKKTPRVQEKHPFIGVVQWRGDTRIARMHNHGHTWNRPASKTFLEPLVSWWFVSFS